MNSWLGPDGVRKSADPESHLPSSKQVSGPGGVSGTELPSSAGRAVSICHILSGDRWAGAEAQTATALRFLARRPDVSVAAIVFNEGRLARELRTCGVPVEVVAEDRHGFLSIVRAGSRLLRSPRPMILHSHGYKANVVSFAIAGRCGIDYLVRSQHGLPEPYAGVKRWKNRVLHAVDAAISRYRTDCVISVSRELRGHLVRSIPPEKVTIVSNGLDLARVSCGLSPVEARLRLGLPADAVVIGSAGRLEPVKRIDRLIEAAALILPEVPAAHVVIAGDGTEEERLRGLAQLSPARERIHFLGYRDDIHDVLRAMDIFVLCSEHEGLPMVLLEALWLGLPVVGSAVGGIAEVIEDGVSGVLLADATPQELARACVRLAHDPELRHGLSEQGRRRVRETFSAEDSAARLAELYLVLVGQGEGTRKVGAHRIDNAYGRG